MREFVCPVVAILVAGLPLTTPAAAQYWNNDYNYGRLANPNNPNFDPAAAAINALNTSFPRQRGYSTPIDFSLIDAMERGDTRTYSTHRGRCAARFVTYSLHRQLCWQRRQVKALQALGAQQSKHRQYQKERAGWGTWIRTKIDGVRVRSSTIELFPKR